MIISVDHGNKSIKTPNTLFTSGLISSEGLQGFKTDYICWNGRYYTLTEQRISYLRDKTEDERFYVLTLFAIAKELERRKAAETLDPIDITLLIGLPPAHYEQLHSRFEQYFLRRREAIDFEYNGKYYSIRISKVLSYPESVRLLISSEGTTLAIQACDKDDPCAVPFMSGRTAEDLKGQKKWTTVSNRMLMHIIRTKLGWDSGKTPRRFYGVPWPEQYAILFDLTRAAPPRTRTPNLSVEDMLRTYELAASGTLMPVGDNTWAKTNKFASVPPSRVIEAQFVNVT